MKPIKHMRSKRGFYIGRVRQVENHANHSKLSSEMIGTPGRGMAWTWHQLMTLASEHHKGERECISIGTNAGKHFGGNKSQ